MKATIESGGQQQEELLHLIEAAEHEAAAIKSNFPKTVLTIEKGKDRLALAKGMSLKEMLAIQQVVAKAEENILLGESRILQLLEEKQLLLAEYQTAKEGLAELKRQYNEKVKVYNKEKERIGLQFAALLSQEETLKLDLDAQALTLYNEAAKVVPLNPVSILHNGFCSGCRVGVSTQKARLVARNEVLQRCDQCGRLLLPQNVESVKAE